MPERILGIDIGGSALKAVLLSRGFRGGYRVLGVRTIDLAAAGDLPEAVRQLFTDPAFRGSVCLTALPAGALSFRNIRLPFRDDRRIRQTIASALEPVIQQPLDEIFIDYTVTGRTEQTEIFAALAPRALVGERTALLSPYVRETAVMDIDVIPLAARLMEKPDFTESTLLIDIGAGDTTAVFMGKGRILHIRHFPFGGQQVTSVMAAILKTGLPEAEARKRCGEIPPAAASALRECCGRFLAELKNTQVYLLRQGNIPRAPERVILTGGGSRTPGLAEEIAELFAVPVERTDLAAMEGIQIEEALRETWDPAIMDQALALAARPMAKGSGFNFRQRAFEARAGYGEFRTRMRKGAVLGLVILTLAGVELGLDDYGSRLRLAALKREITAQFRKIDPTVTRIVDPVAQLRGKIAEARKVSAGMGDAAPAASVLDILKEISGLSPADLLIASFNIDGDAISLKGEAGNFDAVDAIKKALMNSKYFKTVSIGSTSMQKQGSGVEFDMKIILKQ